MGSSVRYWSTTPASNNTSDPDITSADSQNPASVDDNIRSVMAGVAKQEADTGGALTAGGSANALTVTTNQVLTAGQLTGGLRISVVATAANTATVVTFAPDGLTPANIKRSDGSVLAVGSITVGRILDLVYNSGASEWRAVNIDPLQPAASIISPTSGVSGAAVFLTQGTWSGLATGDIVLTGYGAYRALQIVLNAVNGTGGLYMRLSANGGVSYDSGASDYTTIGATGAGSTTGPQMNVSNVVTNTTTPPSGLDVIFTLFNPTWPLTNPRAFWNYIASGPSSTIVLAAGGGIRNAAQITSAVRFLFSSSNITGNYAVYGLS